MLDEVGDHVLLEVELSVGRVVGARFEDDRVPPFDLGHALVVFEVAGARRHQGQRRHRVDARLAGDLRDLALQLVQFGLHAHAAGHLLELALLVEVERAPRPRRRLDGHARVEELAVHRQRLVARRHRLAPLDVQVRLQHLALLGPDVGLQRRRVARHQHLPRPPTKPNKP